MVRLRKIRKNDFFITLLSLCLLLSFSLEAKSRKHRRSRKAKVYPFQFHVGGSYKAMSSLHWLKQEGIFAKNRSLKSEQRLRVQGSCSYRDFSLEVASEISLFSEQENPSTILIPDFEPKPAWDARSDLVAGDDFRVTHRIDRFFLKYRQKQWEALVGKQVVSMGVGKIFSAVSQTPRLSFVWIDSEYPITEDAITFRWMDNFIFEARYLPKVKGQQGQNFHLRAKKQLYSSDLGVSLGRSDDKAFIGLEGVGDLMEGLWRGELVAYRGDETDLQAIIGYERVFSAEWKANLELFLNTFGHLDANKYQIGLFHRSTPYKGALYAGTSVEYQISPLLKSQLTIMANLGDASFFSHLSFNYSLSQTLDLLMGQYLGIASSSDGEFGGTQALAPGLRFGLPSLTYAVFRFYF